MDSILFELRKIPPVTRFIVLGTLVETLLVLMKVVPPYAVIWYWPFVKKLQIWRFVTQFLLGSMNINLIFELYGLFTYGSQLETAHFQERTADAVYGFGIIATLIFILTRPLGRAVLSQPLLMAVMQLWALSNPTAVCVSRPTRTHAYRVNLFGFISIQSTYLPFAMLAIGVLQAGPGILPDGIAGILAAQLWWYLSEVYPRNHGGRQLPALKTPQLLKRYLGNGNDPAAPPTATTTPGYRVGAGRAFPPAAGRARGGPAPGSSTTTATTATGYRWGAGNRLGES